MGLKLSKSPRNPRFLKCESADHGGKAATCPQQTEIISKLFNGLFNLLKEGLLQLVL